MRILLFFIYIVIKFIGSMSIVGVNYGLAN